MTVRICTARLDDETLAAAEDIPASLGGAGAGCREEILLFNPEEKYDSPAARRRFVAACRERLSAGGVTLREVREMHPAAGSGTFVFR